MRVFPCFYCLFGVYFAKLCQPVLQGNVIGIYQRFRFRLIEQKNRFFLNFGKLHRFTSGFPSAWARPGPGFVLF